MVFTSAWRPHGIKGVLFDLSGLGGLQYYENAMHMCT